MYRHPGEIPDDIVAANIRALRLRNGWSLARLGERMGWPTPSTVCDAEGRRYGRQRRFTADEVARLAAIFGVSPQQLTSQCAHCESRPPAGFACLQCGVYSPLGNIGTRPRPRGDIKLPGVRAADRSTDPSPAGESPVLPYAAGDAGGTQDPPLPVILGARPGKAVLSRPQNREGKASR